jgi:hypothetical protein
MAPAGAVPTSDVPLSITEVMISLTIAYAAAMPRAARDGLGGASVMVSVTTTRFVACTVVVLAALVVTVLRVLVHLLVSANASVQCRRNVDHFRGWRYSEPYIAECLDIVRLSII